MCVKEGLFIGQKMKGIQYEKNNRVLGASGDSYRFGAIP